MLDYTENWNAAKSLADRLERYYHERGIKWVRVWIEEYRKESGGKRFDIRSNIVFRVPDIKR
jgi:hypothetical protein